MTSFFEALNAEWRRKKLEGHASQPSNTNSKILHEFQNSFQSSSLHSSNNFISPVERSARKIQSVFRSFQLRKELHAILLELELSQTSIQHSMDLILQWYRGWITQFILLFLLIFGVVTIYFQVFSSVPNSHDTDSTLLQRIEQLEDSRASLVEPYGGYAFMHALMDHFQLSNELKENVACSFLLSLICPLNATTYLQYYPRGTDITPDLLKYCADVNRDAGYVDQVNRVVGTIYVSQTRRKTIPCSNRMIQLDPYLNRSRSCLSEIEEDPEYRAPRSCTTCSSFQLHPKYNYYVHALTGDAFNMPRSFMRCRVDGLELDNWLDFKTKQLCFWGSFLDLTRNGRLSAYKECFTFTTGGRVVNERDFVSVSFFAETGFSQSVSMTIAFIVFLCVWQLYQCCKIKTKWTSLLFWFRVVETGLELVANGYFLHYANTVQNFAFGRPVNKTAFFLDTFAFLSEVNLTFEMAQLWTTYSLLTSLGLFFRLSDSIGNLDFHPSSAIVGGVLKHAASKLVSFAFVFFLFVLIYAFIGMLLFSRTSSPRFSTFWQAINTLLLMSTIGEVQELESTVSQSKTTQLSQTIQFLYFWIFVFLATILLMNVLLSIIVGAFVSMANTSEAGETMLSFHESFAEVCWFLYKGAIVRGRRIFTRSKKRTPFECVDALHTSQSPSTAKKIRPLLEDIFYSKRTVERVLKHMRTISQRERMQSQVLFLRGQDKASTVIAGHTLFLLESIDARLRKLETTKRTPTSFPYGAKWE